MDETEGLLPPDLDKCFFLQDRTKDTKDIEGAPLDWSVICDVSFIIVDYFTILKRAKFFTI